MFVVASVACGLAPSLGALVVARFVQGGAAAVMMPSSMALIGQAYPDPVRRARAVAVWAMGGLTYGAIEAGVGFTAPRVVIAFAVAVVALAAFVAAQARGAHPMVPLDLFRSRTVTVAVAVGFAFIVGYYGLPFMMSLYLQQLRGLSSLATGAAFLPMMLVGAVLTPFSARIAERLGARALVSAGLALMTAGLVILGIVPPSTPVWVLAVLMVFVGLAGPLVMPPITAVLLNSVPGHRAGTASGVFNTSRQVGGALAVAVFGALLAQPGRLRAGPAHQPPARRRRRTRGGSGEPPAEDDTGGGNEMSDWTGEELDKIGAADELEIAALRPDGSLRPFTTIWVVRVGDDLYVRSYRGREGAWFRSVLRRPEGRIRAGGVDRDVAFEQPADADHDAIDRAYRSKYARYGGTYVDPMVSPAAAVATLRLNAR